MVGTSNILLLIIILAGIILLQVFLSKKKNRWLGLIIPAIFLLFSIISVIGKLNFSTFRSVQQVENEKGEIIHQTIVEQTKTDNLGVMILSSIYIFVLFNIPTIVLLLIYYSYRNKIKRNKEIDKMNIQDLE